MARPLAFTVVDARDYAARLRQLVRSAKHRIVLAAMLVRSDTTAGVILRDILAAAKRGVKVHILADIYAQTRFSSPTGVLQTAKFKQQLADTQELFAAIQAAGGTATWVGKIHLNPFRGRYHIKATVVDDEVFTFGGINFSDSEFTATDYMLHTTNGDLADRLQQLIAQNARGLPVADQEWSLGPDYSMLYDAGKPGSSLIYGRACELAARSVRVTYVSQMAPTGVLAKALERTNTTYFANRPSQSGLHPNTVGQWLDQRRIGLSNHYEGTPYIHAKVILFTLKDGGKALLSGSHNYSWRGVLYGTKELALYSTNPILWRRLHEVVYKVATSD